MSNGNYFEGNLFTKAMDVLNTPQYFMAGFADGLLSGENPFEAGLEGIGDRHSFVDTLKNHDVPFATPLGVAADFIIPTFAAGKLAKLANMKNIGRLKAIMATEKAAMEGRTLEESLEGAARSLDQINDARAGLHGAEQSADDLTARVLGANRAGAQAVAAGSTTPAAALSATQGTVPSLVQTVGGGLPPVVASNATAATTAANAATTLASKNPLMRPIEGAVKVGKGMLDDAARRLIGDDALEIIKNNTWRRVHDALRQSPLFAGIGEHMSWALKRTEVVTAHMRAAYMTKSEKIIQLIGNDSADHNIWWRLSQGLNLNAEQVAQLASDPERAQRLRDAVKMTQDYFAEDFGLKSKLGIRQIIGAHTQALRRLNAAERKTVMEYIKDPALLAQMEAVNNLPVDEFKLVKLARSIADEGGEVDELVQAVTSPLKRVLNYLPSLTNKEARKRLEKEAYDRAYQLELHMQGLSDTKVLTKTLDDRVVAALKTRIGTTKIVPGMPEYDAKYNEIYHNITNGVRTGRVKPMPQQVLEARARLLTDAWAKKNTGLNWRTMNPQQRKALYNRVMGEERKILFQDIERKARSIAKAEMSDPDEVIAGFQHSRHRPIGNMTEESIQRLANDSIIDPAEIFARHASDSGLVLGAAKGYGPQGQLWKAVRENYLLNHGVADNFRPEDLDPLTSHGLNYLTRLHKLTTGNGAVPLDRAVSAAGKVADFMFLGPRTVLVQTMNLANSASHAGVANAFATMAETMTNPEMRAIGARLANVFPNVGDYTTDKSKFAKLMDKFNFLGYGGIKASDTNMRAQSAMAAMLDSFGREQEILKHVRSGNLGKARQLADRFKLDYATDVSYLLDPAHGALKNADILRIGEIGSIKSNFGNSILDQQMMFNSPTGKFFLKFKNFSAHQTNFITGMLSRFKQTGNPAEILRYTGTFGWTYDHMQPILDVFKNPRSTKKDKEDASKKLQSAMMIGMFGYLGDAALALGSDSEALGLGVVTGPIPNAALRAKTTIGALLQGDFNKALEQGPALPRQYANIWRNRNGN